MQASQEEARSFVVDEAQHGTRSFRVLCLGNRMRVVLISDPTSTLTAASMSVQVGSFMDPEDIPGLAHLLEHVLFLGTEKHPNNGEFRTFLTDRGGATNADTSSTVSTFYYYVGDEHAEEALQRFSEFFKSPLLSADTIEGEVGIVHSEFESMLFSDAHRQLQVMRGTSSKQSPFSRILIGTRDTLLRDQQDLHLRLKSFFNDHYSASLMNLAVLSSQPADVLQSWIVDNFCNVPDRQLPLYEPVFRNAFDSLSCVNKIHRINSVQGYKNLSLMFELDYNEARHCKVRTSDVIVCLMRNQSRFRYLEHLRTKGLASNYTIIPFEGTAYLQFIVILTNLGIDRVNDVILLTFKYMSIVKESNEAEIHAAFLEASHECGDLAELPPEELCQYVSNTMAEMTYVSKSLLEDPVSSELQMNQIKGALQRLHLDRCRIDLLYPWEELKLRPINILTEQFYGTEYSVESLSQSFIKKLENPSCNSSSTRLLCPPRPSIVKLKGIFSTHFRKLSNHFKSKNKFIPSDSTDSFCCENLKNGYPQILVSNSVVDLWHCNQRESCTCISLMFQSRAIFDCPTLILGRLFIKLANLLVLQSFQKQAIEAGFKIDISSGHFPGLTVHCSGRLEKISFLMQEIAKMLYLSRFPKKAVYRKALSALIREIGEVENRNVISISEHQLHECILDFVYPKHDEAGVLPMITFDILEKFARNFFHTGHWTVLATGNISQKTAIEITSLFTNMTRVGRPFRPPRVVALPTNGAFIVSHFVTHTDRNSAVTMYFQLVDSTESYRSKSIAFVLIQLLAAPVFEQLRTQEKLGYIVQSKPHLLNGVIGLSITVQSERFSPEYICQRINIFIGRIEGLLRDVSLETVSNVTKAAANTLRIDRCHASFWENIRDHIPVLQHEAILELVLKVTKDDLEQLYLQRLGLKATERRQMVSMVYGYERQSGDKLENAFYVDDKNLFRQSQPVFVHKSAMAA